MEQISFADKREKRFSAVNLLIKPNNQFEPEPLEVLHGTQQKRDTKESSRPVISRSEVKTTRSAFSTKDTLSNAASHTKDVRMKLDFFRTAAERDDFISDRKCGVNENYISKKFVLRKMNYSDIRQEVEKINRVSSVDLAQRKERGIN